MQLKNKNIFITGSSRGIGLAIAHKFAQAKSDTSPEMGTTLTP